MRCNKCPLFTEWHTEDEYGASCGVFGDSWDNKLQYEDKEGTQIIGCYVDRNYIKKHNEEYERELENRVKWYLEQEG